MTNSILRKTSVFYIHLILLHSVKPQAKIGVYFKPIKGTDSDDSTGDKVPLIQKEFFTCGREQSCTHVVQLANDYVTIHGSEELEMRKDIAVRIYEKVKAEVSSCLEYYRLGVRRNGQYNVYDRTAAPFQVYCDFESEANSVWTLVTSFALKNMASFRTTFSISNPRNEMNPNWKDYRLGLERMKYIRSTATLWRATCSFLTYKSKIYRDYMRLKFTEADMLALKCWPCCNTMEYINIRGHEGSDIEVPLWQENYGPMHIDSSFKHCEYDAMQGGIADEDNFGHYYTINRAFRCTETDESTTQFWMGWNV